MPSATRSNPLSNGRVPSSHRDDRSSSTGWSEDTHSSSSEQSLAVFYWTGKLYFEWQLADFVAKKVSDDTLDRMEAQAESVALRFPYQEGYDKLSEIWPPASDSDFKALCIDSRHAFLTSLGSILAYEDRDLVTLARQLQTKFVTCWRNGHPARNTPSSSEGPSLPQAQPEMRLSDYAVLLNEFRGLAGGAKYVDCGRDDVQSDMFRGQWNYGGTSWDAVGHSKAEAKHKAAKMACGFLGLGVHA